MKAHTVHAVRFYESKPRAGHTFEPDGRLFSVGLHGFVFQHYVCENAIENPTVPEFWPVTSGM